MGLRLPDKCINGGYKKVDDFLDLVNQAKLTQTIDFAVCIMSDGCISKNRSLSLLCISSHVCAFIYFPVISDDIKYTEKQTEVVTQCLSVKTLQKFARSPKNDTLLENIVLKINAKCGGLNNDLMTRQDPV